MKKRTAVIVALAFLLAAAPAYVPAAATPAPAPLRTPSRASATPPLTSEQAALVVEPGQIRQFTLSLNPGDRVDGRTTVVYQDVNFIIRDPHGQIILNAGQVTEKDFSFVAAVPGSYEFAFNSSSLVYNRVVLVQVRHPGAEQLPYFAGTYVALKPGEVKTVPVWLAANQALSGSLIIQGGQQELTFSVSDPNGSAVIPAGGIRGSDLFNLTATTPGAYKLCLDNSLSAYMSKLVSVSLSTSPGGKVLWFGTPTRLAFTVLPAGATRRSEFTTQPTVTVLDADGNTASTYNGAVTVSITPGTGTSGAILTGTTTATALNGVATFAGLTINLAGSGYTLTVAGLGLTSATSGAFDVTRGLPIESLALNAGWNLISLPLVPSNSAIESVLSGVSTGVISVWHYDTAPAAWSNYVPDLGGTLTTMSAGNAYWINMSAPAILTVASPELTARRPVPQTYRVAAGWNMVGFKSTTPRSAGTYLAGTNYRIFPVYGYLSGAYFTVSPGADALEPGLGYWVYFNEPGVIRP